MKPEQATLTEEVLAGLVERVTYHNVENGFCVLRAESGATRTPIPAQGGQHSGDYGQRVMAA